MSYCLYDDDVQKEPVTLAGLESLSSAESPTEQQWGYDVPFAAGVVAAAVDSSFADDTSFVAAGSCLDVASVVHDIVPYSEENWLREQPVTVAAYEEALDSSANGH